LVNEAGKDDGFVADTELYSLNDGTKGYSYEDGNNTENNTIGINTQTVDISESGEVVNVAFHETTNKEIHSNSEQTALNRGNTAESIWELQNFGNENTNTMSGSDWNDTYANSPTINSGNSSRINNYSNYYKENVVEGNKDDVSLDELTIYLQGTDLFGKRAKNKEASIEHGQEMAELIAKTLGDEGNGVYFDWNGENTMEARTENAYRLKEFVENYEFKEDEPLNLVGHSHGGNVNKIFTQIYNFNNNVDNLSQYTNYNFGTEQNQTSIPKDTKIIDNFILLATPNLDNVNADSNIINNYYNFYDRGDWLVQGGIGGIDTKIQFKNPYNSKVKVNDWTPSQTIPNATNIEIYQTAPLTDFSGKKIKYAKEQGVGFYNSHVNMNSPETWKEYIEPEIKNNINN